MGTSLRPIAKTAQGKPNLNGETTAESNLIGLNINLKSQPDSRDCDEKAKNSLFYYNAGNSYCLYRIAIAGILPHIEWWFLT